MKTIISLTFILLPYVLMSQLNMKPAPGGYIDEHPRILELSGNRDVIWSEDFYTGINSSWENAEQGGVASWEFRGPLTIPDIEVGSRGTCFPAGTTGDHIDSQSWENGFVIFDSNWWDNPNNPCIATNFGTGPAPGPHLATLTSPSIDLSAHPGVALVFNQYLKRYNGETRVEVSADGGPWQVAFINPTTPNPTLTNDQQFVQISAYAGGHADVKIRFVFDGLYYFWLLDDIAIVDTYINDLGTRKSTYGDFDIFDVSHPTGYEFLEYTKYPDEMAPHLKFSTQCTNLGGASQTNCRLNIDVLDAANNEIHNAQSAEGFEIVSGGNMELRASDFQMPATMENYRVAFRTSQDELEEFENNNRDTLRFNINDVQYARDRIFASAVYLGTPEYANTQYEVGNVFLVTAPNQSLYSISVAVGVGSSASTSIYGALYSYNLTQNPPLALIATTPSIEITSSMLNSFGDQIITNLTFSTPVPVNNGATYFVAAGSTQGPDNFVCALSGDAEEFTALVKFFPSDYFYLDRIPMVRMNFGFYNGVNESSSATNALKVFPVPARDMLNIALEDWMNLDVSISVFDLTGRKVMHEYLKNNQQKLLSIDVGKWTGGLYEILLYTDRKSTQVKFIRE